MILFYPKAVTDKGSLRNQYAYITDILPTTLDIVGIKAPSIIKGIQQDTLQGYSLAYSINNASAPSRRTQQYYYIFGSRSMYKDGWKAAYAFEPSVKNGLTNKYSVEDTLHNDWHLYNLNEDFNERFDLAKKQFDSSAFFMFSTAEVKDLLKDENAKFDPSAACVHPINKRLYILSSAGNLLVIADTRGKIIEAYKECGCK